MLTAIYYILRDDVEYRDLGPNYSIPLTARGSAAISCGALRTWATMSSSKAQRESFFLGISEREREHGGV
jgi:hypothetical protein